MRSTGRGSSTSYDRHHLDPLGSSGQDEAGSSRPRALSNRQEEWVPRPDPRETPDTSRGSDGHQGVVAVRRVPETKISVPELPVDLVHRPRLRRELDRAVDVALLCAPAGYGKTTLLAEWVNAASDTDTAWVRVDRDDDDPRRLWSAVLAAIGRCRSLPPSSLLRAGAADAAWDLAAAGSPEFLTELIEALAILPGPLRLVLDDIHEVTHTPTIAGIHSFLRDRPAGLRVILSGRLDPPLGLQRLRPEGRLTELRSDRLRFDREEAETLLHRLHLPLTDVQLDRLHRQTDGWPAGLRLAAAAMAGTADGEVFLAEFSGDERSVADYLVGEVLSTLPRDTVDFLQVISVCDAISLGLACALSGREDAGRVLAQLERQSGLVRPVGRNRGTWRVQPLLNTYLHADLKRSSPQRIARLHTTAARWWLDWGRPATALEHAARSDDPRLLTTVVRQVAVPLLVAGDLAALQRALRASGDAVVAADPWLSVVAALVAYARGDTPAAQAAARHVHLHWPASASVGLAVLRAAGEELGALPLAADLVDPVAFPGANDIVPAEPAWESLVELARCAGQLRLGADPQLVRRAADGARLEARHAGFDMLYLQGTATAAMAAAACGDLRAVRETAAEGVAFASVRGWQTSPWALDCTAMLALAMLLTAQPEEAGRLAAEGLTHAERAVPRQRFALAAIRGAALADEGDRAGATAALRRARSALGDSAAGRVEIAVAATAEFESAIRLGQYAAARTVQCWLSERLGETAEALLMKARAELAAGRNHHARLTLRRVVEGGASAVLPSTLVEALLQEAAVAVSADDRFAARRALQSAVELAEPREVVRPFVHVGPEVRELLAQRYGSLEVADTFGGRVLAAGARRAGGLESVLSRCELVVLAMLSSLQSLEEIAADLTVSVNTVKSHVRSIYSKLGVSSRRGAVLAAHEQGLVLCVGADSSADLAGARAVALPGSRHPRGSSSTGDGRGATDADAASRCR
jgi:LuxR family transcriptional regulator, maltose regulon positive regulatory protein